MKEEGGERNHSGFFEKINNWKPTFLLDAIYSCIHNVTPYAFASVEYLKIGLICFAYVFTSIALSLYNKWLLHPDFHGFTFPVLLICIHSLSNFVFSGFTMILCFKHSAKTSDHWITKISVLEYVKYLAPIGLFFALDVCLTQVSVMNVSIALCEIVKSAIPIAVMVIGFFLGREDIDFLKAATMSVLTFGVVLTVLSEMDYNQKGFLAACFAMFFAVAKLIWMETVLGGKKVPTLLAMFYFSPVSFLSLGIGFFPIELKRAKISPFLSGTELFNTMGYIFIGCLIAFSLNFSELLVIQKTSALTMCVIGILKFVIVIPISVAAFGHHLNAVNVMGIFVTGIGIGLYQYTKYRDIMADECRFERLEKRRRGSNLPSIPEEEEGAYSPSSSSLGSPVMSVELAEQQGIFHEPDMGYGKSKMSSSSYSGRKKDSSVYLYQKLSLDTQSQGI